MSYYVLMSKKTATVIADNGIWILIAICLIGFFVSMFFGEKEVEEESRTPEEQEEYEESVMDWMREEATISMKEAYELPSVNALRTILNKYLNGETDGMYDQVLKEGDMDGSVCGLEAFDKKYYESKFIIWDTETAKYGGRITHVIFTDYPDKIFFTWVYNIGDDENPEYELRSFCENGPREEKEEFTKMLKAMIAEGMFPYSL